MKLSPSSWGCKGCLAHPPCGKAADTALGCLGVGGVGESCLPWCDGLKLFGPPADIALERKQPCLSKVSETNGHTSSCAVWLLVGCFLWVRLWSFAVPCNLLKYWKRTNKYRRQSLTLKHEFSRYFRANFSESLKYSKFYWSGWWVGSGRALTIQSVACLAKGQAVFI